MPILRLRRDGACRECLRALNKGESAHWMKGRGIRCETCGAWPMPEGTVTVLPPGRAIGADDKHGMRAKRSGAPTQIGRASGLVPMGGPHRGGNDRRKRRIERME